MVVIMTKIPDECDIKSLLVNSPYYFIKKIFNLRVDGCHSQILDHMMSSNKNLTLVARGHGKSKILQGYLGWYAINHPNERIIIVSSTDTKSRMFLNTIKNTLEFSPIIEEFYGAVAGTTWTETAITLAGRTEIHTEPTILSVGAGSGKITGMHCDGILAIDDIIDYDSARSELQRDRMLDWYRTTLMPVAMANCSTVVVGTRYAVSDLYSNLISEFSFDTMNLPAISEDGNSLCEWLAPLKDKVDSKGNVVVKGLETIKTELGSVIWGLQYLNDTTLLKAGTIFKYEDFMFYDRIIFDESNIYAELLNGTKELIKKLVIGIDLAISEKQTADYTAMLILGKSTTGNIYVLDYINARLTFNSQVELIENLVEKWTPNEVVIEQVAYQAAMIDELRRRGGLKVIPITPTRDKVARAYLVSGMVESRLVHFKQKGHSDVTDDLTIFPDGTHDDITDAFVYALGRMKYGTVDPISVSL
jgi:predicted phage terminase large subunit-like protein